MPLGGRVYRLTKFAEKPTAEFARENLATPGLGTGDGGEGRHLVVFGQASVSPVSAPAVVWYVWYGVVSVGLLYNMLLYRNVMYHLIYR